MGNIRFLLLFLAVFACCGVYFFNLKYIVFMLRELLWRKDLVIARMWTKFGLQTGRSAFIQYDQNGVKLNDVQAYRSNLLIRRHHRPTDVKVTPRHININVSDVLVIIHIQKTGGTFLEDNLALNLNVYPRVTCDTMKGVPDRIWCQCSNNRSQVWMTNRHCTGWLCGLHASLDELVECVEPWFSRQEHEESRVRRYHYITLIRDPVTRFFSEWLHVRRGATWMDSKLRCDGRDATLQEVPYCFRHGHWRNVSMAEFLNCSSNMAFNRMTRMLANLSLSDCFRLDSNLTTHRRQEIMLQSAKDNLARFLAFYGIVEMMAESQLLFEKTFLGLTFRNPLKVKRSDSSRNYAVLSEPLWLTIMEKNSLDVRLYQYARDLFLQRLNAANITARNETAVPVIVTESFKYKVLYGG